MERRDDEPTPFISTTFSLAYALFAAGRFNARHGCTDTQISIIDTAKMNTSAWLATELVGASWTDAAFFAGSAQEVLVYRRILVDAVVATVALDEFLDCLPRWCGDVGYQIQRYQLHSTEAAVHALADAAFLPASNMAEEESALEVQSVKRSIWILRSTLPPSMADCDLDTHADAVDAIARLAALFVWWPKWITAIDPVAYPLFLLFLKKPGTTPDALQRL